MPKLEKLPDHGHKLISSEDGEGTPACTISGQSLYAFSGKCPETSPDGRTYILEKTHMYCDENRWRFFCLLRIIQESGVPTESTAGSGRLISSQYHRPIDIDGRTDWHAVKRLRLVGWTNGPMYRSKEGISGFGRTDGQPENKMPPAPKGGGINIGWVLSFHSSFLCSKGQCCGHYSHFVINIVKCVDA